MENKTFNDAAGIEPEPEVLEEYVRESFELEADYANAAMDLQKEYGDRADVPSFEENAADISFEQSRDQMAEEGDFDRFSDGTWDAPEFNFDMEGSAKDMARGAREFAPRGHDRGFDL